MPNRCLPTLMLCTLLATAGAAVAQSTEQALRPRTDAKSGIEYVQGGAGEGEMNAIKAMQSQYPLHIVFSRNTGEYVVPDRVTVSGTGGMVLDLSTAGPAVLAKLPPGRYTVTAQYLGGMQKRTVDVGASSKVVSWNWGAADDARTR